MRNLPVTDKLIRRGLVSLTNMLPNDKGMKDTDSTAAAKSITKLTQLLSTEYDMYLPSAWEDTYNLK